MIEMKVFISHGSQKEPVGPVMECLVERIHGDEIAVSAVVDQQVFPLEIIFQQVHQVGIIKRPLEIIFQQVL